MAWFSAPVIGIDIGHGSIKAVQLTGRGRSSLAFAGLVELAPPESETSGQRIAAGLASLNEDYRLSRQPAAICFTQRPLVIRHVTMPAIPDHELAEALRWEAKKHFSCALDELVVDYLPLGREGGAEGATVSVVLVAAERAALMAEVEPLKRAGLKVVAIDANPLAWIAAVQRRAPELLEGNVGLIDLGAGKVDINMVRNGALLMTRRVAGGGHEITAALARELSMSYDAAELLKRQIGLENPKQALDKGRADRYAETVKQEINRLILEIQRSIEFFRVEYRQTAIHRLLLGGGTSLLAGLRAYMAGYFESSIELEDPFSDLKLGATGFDVVRAQAPRFAAAMGMACWGA
ncbi:MAG: type IV pilus assembly protein PilM [Nitrospirota bacterium]